MKSIVTLALVMMAVSAQAFIGPVGKSTAVDYAGSVISGTVEKHYINVKNGGSTINAGAVVALDLTADDGATIATNSTAGASPFCIMVNSCAANKLCKCQNYGPYDAALFDFTPGAAVAGKRWYMSTNNAGYVSARATDVATEVAGGIFYDAASASGTVQVFIDLN